jgi:hypothetical protein
MRGQRLGERDVLFVGGPWHGRRHTIRLRDDGELPSTFLVAGTVRIEWDSLEMTQIPPFVYDLRFFRQGPRPAIRDPSYVNPGGERYGQGHPDATRHDVALADWLLDQLEHDAVPACIAPGCEAKAPVLFTAGESGRLGGRDWRRGDEIRLCRVHAGDIYRAQGVHGRNQLAQWLRPDAMLDPLDAYDIGHAPSCEQSTLVDQYVRTMRVQVR